MKAKEQLIQKIEKFAEGDETLAEINKSLQAETIFSQPKKIYKSLGMGLHNGVFYYGTSVEISGIPYSVIVTSDRKYYIGDEITEQFGLAFREEFDSEALDFQWSNEAILSWLNGQQAESGKKLFEAIRNINQEFCEHTDSRIHDYVAMDIISDYLFRLFSHQGRTYFHAERGSGKTKQSLVYWLLGFNTMWMSNTTEAVLFRSIEATSGTPIVDNLDNMNEESMKAINQQLQTGFGEESTVRRVEGEAKRRTRKYLNYSPMPFNNIIGIDETSLERCHEIPMLKTTDQSKAKVWPTALDPRWQELRNQLRVFALTNWQGIKDVYDKIDIAVLCARETDVEKAILATAYFIDKKIYERLLGYVQEHWQRRSIKNLDSDWKFFLFREIKNILAGKNIAWISLSDITDLLMPLCKNVTVEHKDYKKEWNSLNRWIASSVSAVSLFREKRIVHGRTEVSFKLVDVEKYMKLHGYVEDSAPTNSTLSTYTTNSTNSTKEEDIDGRDGRAGRAVEGGRGCDICHINQAIVKKTMKDGITGKLEEAWLCKDCLKGEDNNAMPSL